MSKNYYTYGNKKMTTKKLNVKGYHPLLPVVGSKQYLGKDLQMSDIDTMTPEQINKLYCRYEARLGASMTKTLGNSFINLYVMGVSKYFQCC